MPAKKTKKTDTSATKNSTKKTTTKKAATTKKTTQTKKKDISTKTFSNHTVGTSSRQNVIIVLIVLAFLSLIIARVDMRGTQKKAPSNIITQLMQSNTTYSGTTMSEADTSTNTDTSTATVGIGNATADIATSTQTTDIPTIDSDNDQTDTDIATYVGDSQNNDETKATKVIFDFYQNINQKNFDQLANFVDNYMRRSDTFRNYFNTNRLTRFLNGLIDSTIYVYNIRQDGTGANNTKTYSYVLKYNVSGFVDTFVESWTMTLVPSGETYKIGSIMCNTKGCGTMPFFSFAKYGIK